MFGVSEELTICKIIVTAIAVSVVALIYLSFVASLLVFHHWSVTTMECLLLVYVGLEIKIYWLLRNNSAKLLRMHHRIEQIYYLHHIHESILNLSSVNFSLRLISFVSIHMYFYIRTRNELIIKVLSAGKYLPLFYLNVIIINLFASTIFMISMFVCFQMRLTFSSIHIDNFNNGSFYLLIKKKLRIPVENFNDFNVSNKFYFINYIEPLEKLNTLCLVCYNLYLIFVILTIYNFNRNILEISLITISFIILNSYYVLNFFIIKRKRRIIKFISTFIDSIRMFILNFTEMIN